MSSQPKCTEAACFAPAVGQLALPLGELPMIFLADRFASIDLARGWQPLATMPRCACLQS